MPCRVSGNVIICSRNERSKPCVSCGRPSSKLCDYPLRGANVGQTCDRAICVKCTVHQEPDFDFCPTHAAMLTPEGKLVL